MTFRQFSLQDLRGSKKWIILAIQRLYNIKCLQSNDKNILIIEQEIFLDVVSRVDSIQEEMMTFEKDTIYSVLINIAS